MFSGGGPTVSDFRNTCSTPLYFLICVFMCGTIGFVFHITKCLYSFANMHFLKLFILLLVLSLLENSSMPTMKQSELQQWMRYMLINLVLF